MYGHFVLRSNIKLRSNHMTKVSVINLPNFDGELKVEWVLSSVSDNVKIVDVWADGKPWKLSWMPEKTVKLINKQLIEEQCQLEQDGVEEFGLDAWDIELMSNEEANWLEDKVLTSMGV